MKNKYILIIAFLFSFSSLTAKEASSSLVFNFQSHVLLNNSKWGGSFNPINPGGEIVYRRKLNNVFSVSSGLSYIYSSWNRSVGGKSYFKRISHELFIPFVFKSKLNEKLYLECGIYPGRLINGKELYRNNIDIKNWRENTHNTNYDESPKYSIDLFFGVGLGIFESPSNKEPPFSIIPFVKYKLKDNWMGEIRTRVNFGVKLSFSI